MYFYCVICMIIEMYSPGERSGLERYINNPRYQGSKNSRAWGPVPVEINFRSL